MKPGATEQTQQAEGDKSGTAAQGEKDQGKAAAAGQQGDQNQQADDDSIYSDPAKVKELVKSLRDENAKHRNKNKDLEGRFTALEATQKKLKQALGVGEEETDPAELAKSLSTEKQALEVELGIAHLALEHGVPKDGMNYFRFLLSSKLEGLEEGAELTEDDVQAIVTEVTKVGGKKAGGGSTGIDASSRPNADATSAVTAEAFAKMNLGEKSALYQKNPEQYNKLFNEAREKRLL